MSATIPTSEPAQIRAGETLSFKITLADYPASEDWVITYTLRALNSSATKIEFASSADGDDHLVTVPFEETAGWLPAKYAGAAIVSDGTTKTQVRTVRLTVLPDISAQEGDIRSQARKTLDNINAVIEGRASSTLLNSEVEGTNLSRIPHDQLLMLRDRYAALVFQEEEAERAANGKPTQRNIYAHFGRLS
jgi:hypothetical protein